MSGHIMKRRKVWVSKAVLWIQRPNTLNFDPYPGFWTILDPDIQGYTLILSILKEKIKNNLREKNLHTKKNIFYIYKNKMSPKEMFTQLSL